jgi:hypothetical protein
MIARSVLPAVMVVGTTTVGVVVLDDHPVVCRSSTAGNAT